MFGLQGIEATQDDQDQDNQDQDDRDGGDDDDSASEGTPRESRRGSQTTADDNLPRSVREATGCRSRAQFEAYISNLQFYTFIESIQCESALSIQPSISGTTEAIMIENVSTMFKHLGKLETYHVFLQNLEIAKQIDEIGRSRNMHSLNVAWDLVNQNRIDYSYSYLKEILTLSWAVYRFPVLKQVKLPWHKALRVIPEIASHFDQKIISNEVLPRNVTAAQSSRYDSAYLRLSLEFPHSRLGDGDGLSGLKVSKVHGLFLADRSCEDESIKQAVISQYPVELRNINSIPVNRVEKRSRLIGFDTQEAPRERGRRDCNVDQRYWENGRDFLEAQLLALRGTISIDDANILVDCYGVDLYDRLLIDIRSVYDAQNSQPNPQPALRRFEIAHRALSSGYSVPTPHYFYSERLAESFQSAVRDRQGAFGEDGPFTNPRVCRLARFNLEKRTTRRRRNLYME